MTQKLIVALLLLFNVEAMACQFDTDCSIGSQCIKKGFSLYGVCLGGQSPGNSNDRKPVYDSLDLNRGFGNGSDGDARNKPDDDGTYGDTCSFDTDCGIGGRCAKSPGSLSGACTK